MTVRYRTGDELSVVSVRDDHERGRPVCYGVTSDDAEAIALALNTVAALGGDVARMVIALDQHRPPAILACPIPMCGRKTIGDGNPI